MSTAFPNPGAHRPAIALHAATAPAQIAQVRELFVEYARSLGVSLCFQGFDAELAGLPGAYAPPRGCLLLACAGETPLGCIGLRPLAGDRAELKRLYVRPAARGTGLGRRLARAALDRARAAGYRRVCLDTLPAMREAARLYEALGFRATAPYYDNPLPGVRYLELALDVQAGA